MEWKIRQETEGAQGQARWTEQSFGRFAKHIASVIVADSVQACTGSIRFRAECNGKRSYFRAIATGNRDCSRRITAIASAGSFSTPNT